MGSEDFLMTSTTRQFGYQQLEKGLKTLIQTITTTINTCSYIFEVETTLRLLGEAWHSCIYQTWVTGLVFLAPKQLSIRPVLVCDETQIRTTATGIK